MRVEVPGGESCEDPGSEVHRECPMNEVFMPYRVTGHLFLCVLFGCNSFSGTMLKMYLAIVPILKTKYIIQYLNYIIILHNLSCS